MTEIAIANGMERVDNGERLRTTKIISLTESAFVERDFVNVLER